MGETSKIGHEIADLNGLEIHYAHAGSGPLIVLLHGFPQCWYMFRHQLAHLGVDHLAVAPDLRGYNLSSKPDSLHEYGPWAAGRDVRALAEHLGYERFVLVGHDWGAATAWSFALHHPQMLQALIILATPHPATFDRALRDDLEQQQASRYLLGLRRRDIAPVLCHEDFAALRATLDFPFIDEDAMARYVESWRQPGAVDDMLRWYRREGLGPSEEGTPSRGNYAPEITPLIVNVPTLVIYPTADPYTRPSAHDGLDRYVADLRFLTIEGGSHWIAEEHPQLVNRHIDEFLTSLPATVRPADAALSGEESQLL